MLEHFPKDYKTSTNPLGVGPHFGITKKEDGDNLIVDWCDGECETIQKINTCVCPFEGESICGKDNQGNQLKLEVLSLSSLVVVVACYVYIIIPNTCLSVCCTQVIAYQQKGVLVRVQKEKIGAKKRKQPNGNASDTTKKKKKNAAKDSKTPAAPAAPTTAAPVNCYNAHIRLLQHTHITATTHTHNCYNAPTSLLYHTHRFAPTQTHICYSAST